MSCAANTLFRLIRSDPWRLHVLDTLFRVAGQQAWVAAGFIRNLVWDDQAGYDIRPLEDVDVLTWWPGNTSRAEEEKLEVALANVDPDVPWSVRNQARMHLRNQDKAYRDIGDAMAHWLETATGVAVRMRPDGRLMILASYGLDDLQAGILRPTTRGAEKLQMLEARIQQKGWLLRWPAVKYFKNDVRAYAGTAMESEECRD